MYSNKIQATVEVLEVCLQQTLLHKSLHKRDLKNKQWNFSIKKKYHPWPYFY